MLPSCLGILIRGLVSYDAASSPAVSAVFNAYPCTESVRLCALSIWVLSLATICLIEKIYPASMLLVSEMIGCVPSAVSGEFSPNQWFPGK